MVTLGRLLSETVQTRRDRPALCIHGQLISYRTLDEWSRRIAAQLEGQVIGILAGSSLETYAGIMAVARSGRTYVPLNPEFPNDRLYRTLAISRPATIIVDREHLHRASSLLGDYQALRILIVGDEDQVLSKTQHDIVEVTEASLSEADEIDRPTSDETPLYVLSTSGSTGAPKSIAIPRSNVVDYLGEVHELFGFNEEDRFSHFFKLSFDLSVHDIFAAWTSGACLYVPGPRDLLDPVAFARKHALTVWFSVPSLVSLAVMARKLKADVLPSLRCAIFCGEALSWENVDAFQAAAPNARLTNLYGPTEATIAITHHTIEREQRPPELLSAPVPIGKPFSGQEALVVGADLDMLPPGARGELLLGGSQLAPGYMNSPEQTRGAFFDRRYPGFSATRWYRTGDVVEEREAGFVFLGRCDTQIKYRGHRIELGEIEAVLQRVAKTPIAIVMAWPPFEPVTVERILAFLMPPHAPIDEVEAKMREQLPAHMVPSRIMTLDQPADLILNDNKKVDRSKVAKMYQESV